MATYDFAAIEKKWQAYWQQQGSFKAVNAVDRPKCYVLDMFPYPSGAGLHVGHPLGYVASDIMARYFWAQGKNVLHPMGFDAFGLPAEQYAIQTGQHPAVTTEKNVTYYKQQLQQLGLAFDWEREVQTCAPDYYRWTQWIFLQLFDSWYNTAAQRAEKLDTLIAHFEQQGNAQLAAACDENVPTFTAAEWKEFGEQEQQKMLLKYRLAFLADTTVNWCPALGTVLANEEVKDGFSERGNHPVVRKTMQQWSLRITAYAERLLQDLDDLDWSNALKEMQRNWIGKSKGALVHFPVEGHADITVYSTRPDTLFGATFLVIAPEHPLAEKLGTSATAQAYVKKAVHRSERDRLQEKAVTGVFTGAYAQHPLTDEPMPIWIADYVLGHYGTGAVMAVPAHDDRDYLFAKKFDLPIVQVITGGDSSEKAYMTKEGTLMQSDFLDGLDVPAAITKVIAVLEERGHGEGETTYRLRDAIFSRQRYWGEPFPIYYKDNLPYALSEDQLPLLLPEVDEYKPTAEGAPPLARADNWQTPEGYPLEQSTMPGWAGSSWYFLRYMDAHNPQQLVDKEAQAYWHQVDLYIGGTEHATGHLLYARFWTKFLYDRGFIGFQEPFQKLVNQGMIQGVSQLAYRVKGEQRFVSRGLREQYDTTPLHVDVKLVDANGVLDVEGFKQWRPDLAEATFVLEEGKFYCSQEVEKMSKSKFNVVNPDDIIAQYGADTLRLYLMFLGPLEQAKPWNTHGIEGVFRFLTKTWRLFYQQDTWAVTEDAPAPEALKALHQAIHKVTGDVERYAFNTAVSTLMITVNTLTTLQCRSRVVLGDLVRLLAPLAPHLAEELWQQLGHEGSVLQAGFPAADPAHLQEDTCTYAVAINGKTRTQLTVPVDMDKATLEEQALADPVVQKWLAGKTPKKVIVVPKRMVNVVI